MANTVFKLRRSSVAGKVPNTSSIAIGELGLNLTDRILYSSDGTNVFEIGANNRIVQVSNNIFIGNSSVNTFVNSSLITVNNATISNLVISSITANNSKGSFGQVLTTNGTGVYWATSVGGSGTGLLDTRQQYVGDGTTTTYTVSGGYQANSLSVYLNGVLLRNGTDVDVTGGLDFIFTTPPANGALIDVVGISTYYSNGTATVVSQQFTANGTANSFVISGGYIANNIQVFLNGVKQINGTDVITTSGNTVNFVETPANGFIVDVFGYQQDVLVVSGTYTYGNSTVNTAITAGSITINGYAVLTNYANGSTGSAGQVLASNGTGVYWKNDADIATNTAASYTWTNTHTFSNTVTFGNTTANSVTNSSVISIANTTGTANITPTSIFLGNSTVNCVINSTSVYVNGVDYNPTTALAIAVALS